MFIVKTTVASRADAKKIARALVTKRLCGCVWISKIESVYRWKGKIVECPEFLLEAKCPNMKTASLAFKLIESIHKYEIPLIEIYKSGHVNSAYSKWLKEET